MASRSLTGAVAAGAVWVTAGRLAIQVLQFAVGLALARILSPTDFGLLASVYVVSNFAATFFDFGLSGALIHKTDPTERDRSTVFWINLLAGVVFALLVWAASPLAADFFGMPELTTLLPITGLSLLMSFGVVHRATLQRQLRLATVTTVDITAAVVGFATMLVMAVSGAGAVSLAVGPVVTSAVTSVLLVAVVRWWPRHLVSRQSVRELWAFSSGVLGYNLVNYWATNTDNLLIGRYLGAAPLGLYNRAFNLMLLPVNQVTGALGSVIFPALASIKEDLARAGAAYVRCVRVIIFLTAPALAGIAAVAPALVPLLWGPRWDGVVPILQVLCVAGIAYCLSITTRWVMQSQGRTRLMFVTGVLDAVVRVTGMVIGLQWGAVGVGVGVMVSAWVVAPVELYLAGSLLALRGSVIARAIVPAVGTAAVMGVLVWVLPGLLGLDRTSLAALAAQVVLGAAVYAVGSRLVDRTALAEVRQLLRRKS